MSHKPWIAFLFILGAACSPPEVTSAKILNGFAHRADLNGSVSNAPVEVKIPKELVCTEGSYQLETDGGVSVTAAISGERATVKLDVDLEFPKPASATNNTSFTCSILATYAYDSSTKRLKGAGEILDCDDEDNFSCILRGIPITCADLQVALRKNACN